MGRVKITGQRREIQRVDKCQALSDLVRFVKLYPHTLKPLATALNKLGTVDDFEKRWPVLKNQMWMQASHLKPRLINHIEQLHHAALSQTEYSAEEYWWRLKGRLLERLAGDHVEERHVREGGQYADNALVEVDDQPITYGFNKTCDIAGIANNRGVFYEAKTVPSLFDQDDVGYLTLLYQAVTATGMDAVVGGLALFDREEYERGARFGHLKENNPNLCWFGYQDIEERRL